MLIERCGRKGPPYDLGDGSWYVSDCKNLKVGPEGGAVALARGLRGVEPSNPPPHPFRWI